ADVAVVRVDNVMDDAEADAGAADLRVHGAAAPVERLEDVRQIGAVDPQAAVGDAHAQPIPIPIDVYLHGGAARAVLHRVADDVLDGGAQCHFVAGDRRQRGRRADGDGHAALARIGIHALHGLTDYAGEVDVGMRAQRCAGGDTGELQHALD